MLDLGCGTGQMTIFLANGRRRVVGADLARASAGAGGGRGAQVRRGTGAVRADRSAATRASARGDSTWFCRSGVLHHTPDPRAAFGALARLARPEGMIVVGLYNAFARLPHRLRRLLARATGMRLVLGDPVLRARQNEPTRRAAWLRDQYLHPEEHRHTLGEVQGWFQDNDVEYLRCYPSALLDGEAPRGDELFSPAEDDWWPEGILAQLGWMRTLGAEGGLFVVIGRRRALSAR